MHTPYICTRVSLYALLIASIFSIMTLTVRAQETGSMAEDVAVPVIDTSSRTADVTMTHAALTHVEGRTLSAELSLTSAEVQEGVRYGVILYHIGENGALTTVDADVANEMLTLRSGEPASRKLTYTAPARLTGEYTIALEARTVSNLMLARRIVGTHTFEAADEVVRLEASSCMFHNLTVSGELRCSIGNLGVAAKQVRISIALHETSVFGIGVGEPVEQTVTIPAGTVEHISFTGFETELSGGMYAVEISFLDASDGALLHRQVFTEQIGEMRSTISNLFLDDTASVLSVIVDLEQPRADLQYTISAGGDCVSLSVPVAGPRTDITLPECPGETLNISLVTTDGTVLDTKEIEVSKAYRDTIANDDMRVYAGVLLVSLIMLLALFTRSSRKHKMLVILAFCFMIPQVSDAQSSVALNCNDGNLACKNYVCPGNSTANCLEAMSFSATAWLELDTGASGSAGVYRSGETIFGTAYFGVGGDDAMDRPLGDIHMAPGCPQSGTPCFGDPWFIYGPSASMDTGSLAGMAWDGSTPVSMTAPSTPGTYTVGYHVYLDPGPSHPGYIQSFSYGYVTITVVPAPACTGSIPGGASAWDAEESTGLSSNTPWTYAGTDTATKCQFKCDVGTWNGTSCATANVCTGSIPSGSVSWDTVNDPDDEEVGLSSNTPWTYAGTDTATKCQYTCDSGYGWNGSSCVPAAAACMGSIPSGSVRWDAEEEIGVSANTWWTYAGTDTATKCQYTCDSGYGWNGSSCVPTSFACTGSIPSGASEWDAEESTGLSSNTPWTYAGTDTATKCQFKCDVGTWDGVSCVAPAYSTSLAIDGGLGPVVKQASGPNASASLTWGSNYSYSSCSLERWNGSAWISLQNGLPATRLTSYPVTQTPAQGMMRYRILCAPYSVSNEVQFTVTSQYNLNANMLPTVNGTLMQGQSVTFNGQVRNSGAASVTNAFSDNFTYRWGTSGAWTQIGSHLGQPVPLGISGTANDTSSSFTLTNTGTLQIQHCVDSQGQILESNEGDNCAVQTFSVATPGPTLLLTVNPGSVQADALSGLGSTTLSWTGSGFPGGVNNCGLYQSSNVSMSPQTLILNNVSPTNSTLNWQAPGTQYYRVTCPTQSANSNVVSFTVTPPPSPNLTANMNPTVSGTLMQGQSVTFSGQVRNSGTVPVTASFSDNFTYCWGAGCSPTAMIGSHIMHSFSSMSPFTVGNTQPDLSAAFVLNNGGTLRVQHCVDSQSHITETNETVADNCRTTDFVVTPTQNLTANISPTVNGLLTQGETVTFNGQVRNSGGVTVEVSFTDNFTYCWGTCVPTTQIGGHISKKIVPFTAGATSDDVSEPFVLIGSGTLYIQHCVDSQSQVGETNESSADNCKTTVFDIATAPNLTASNDGPKDGISYTSPDSITFSGTVQNANATTGSGQLIWADIEVDWNQSDCSAASANFSKNAGGSWTTVADGWNEAVNVTLMSNAAELQNGTHCWRMIVDRDNLVTESDDTDNGATPWYSFTINALEDCENGIDDDGDGLIDGADPACDDGDERAECLGAEPKDATMCANDDTGLSRDTTRELVSACTVPRKCEYLCDAGVPVNGQCITGTIDADPGTVQSGAQSFISWEINGDTSSLSCRVEGGPDQWLNVPDKSGQLSSAVTAQRTYVLSCDGVALDQAVVSLFPPPTLTPDPRIIDPDGAVITLNYNLRGNLACTLSGGGFNNYPLDGSVSQTGMVTTPSPIFGTTVFTITCGNVSGTAIVELRETGHET
jgi:hypothetical protein